MYLVGIDIGKLKHSFCVTVKGTNEVIVEPMFFNNNKDGFDILDNANLKITKSDR